MIYRVEHVTTYEYSQPAVLSYNDLCLDLRVTDRQRIIESRWAVEPEPNSTRGRTDYFGNARRMLAFERPVQRLMLAVRHEVEVVDRTDSTSFSGDSREPGLNGRPALSDVVDPYLWESPFVETGSEFAAYAAPSFRPGQPLCDGVMELTRRIFEEFTYAPRTTSIGTTTRELLENRRGVCQDYAHFALAALRSVDVPARYVSGYLYTQPRPGQEKVYGTDASHAWISVYDGERGWIDFDPTNGVMVGDGHITIAWGRDYGDVTPLRGVVLGGGAQTLSVMVNVIGADR